MLVEYIAIVMRKNLKKKIKTMTLRDKMKVYYVVPFNYKILI
jgi:hypothetical protein